MTESGSGAIRLGLIGDNIKPSQAPRLHREAGRLTGVDVQYDLLIPSELGSSFDEVFEKSRSDRMRGLNITYPYKQVAFAKVTIEDPLVRRLGAINTVLFEGGRALGYNTDYSGFIAAFRGHFGSASPGRTMIVGAGGAGRAVAFALAALGAPALTIVDLEEARAAELADALGRIGPIQVSTAKDAGDAAGPFEGVVNCTPVGMTGHPGMPIAAALLGPQRWGFEAIYTPGETAFLQAALAAGVQMIGGYELFIHQGVDAFRLFTGRSVDERALRVALQRGGNAP